MKVGKILDCLKFGSADGPRIRGGRSAIHEFFTRGCDQQKIAARTVRPWTADGPLDAPVSFGYTNDVSTKQARTVRQVSADGPVGFGQSDACASE